jgi:hypothetical protein
MDGNVEDYYMTKTAGCRWERVAKLRVSILIGMLLFFSGHDKGVFAASNFMEQSPIARQLKVTIVPAYPGTAQHVVLEESPISGSGRLFLLQANGEVEELQIDPEYKSSCDTCSGIVGLKSIKSKPLTGRLVVSAPDAALLQRVFRWHPATPLHQKLPSCLEAGSGYRASNFLRAYTIDDYPEQWFVSGDVPVNPTPACSEKLVFGRVATSNKCTALIEQCTAEKSDSPYLDLLGLLEVKLNGTEEKWMIFSGMSYDGATFSTNVLYDPRKLSGPFPHGSSGGMGGG